MQADVATPTAMHRKDSRDSRKGDSKQQHLHLEEDVPQSPISVPSHSSVPNTPQMHAKFAAAAAFNGAASACNGVGGGGGCGDNSPKLARAANSPMMLARGQHGALSAQVLEGMNQIYHSRNGSLSGYQSDTYEPPHNSEYVFESFNFYAKL